MFGIGEITLIIVALVGIYFFGNKKMTDWAKSIAQMKKSYQEEVFQGEKKR